MTGITKVAIVTGAGRGIGAAIARRLAHDHVVALLDKDEKAVQLMAGEIRKAGRKAAGIACDVSRGELVTDAVRRAEEMGPVAVLVNNAGVGGPFHRVDEVSDEEWDWVISTNLKSVFLFSRLLLPKMKERGEGRVINVASIQGLLGAPLSSTYVASKHGVVGYTRALAAEWGPHGITCNAICPGYVDTAMGLQPQGDRGKQVVARTPVRRIASPEEVAELVAFVAGPHAGYINGASLTIDGGISSSLGIE